jgi:hypothetical protein
MGRLFADLGDVGDFEIDRRQNVECLFTHGIGELFPSQPWTEEWPLNVGCLAHGRLLRRDILAPEVADGGEELQALRLQPVGQPEQGGQVHCGLESTGHLRAALLIEHPRRHRLPRLSSQFDVLHVGTAVFSHDRKVVNPVEGVKWIPNGDFALVTGIIPSRL